jgi:hypothetical protein
MLGGPVATENLIRYELTHEISNHVIIPLHAGMVELLLHSLTSLESPPDDHYRRRQARRGGTPDSPASGIVAVRLLVLPMLPRQTKDRPWPQQDIAHVNVQHEVSARRAVAEQSGAAQASPS